jgi:glycosyltransferase involved in cell wall biosynthesis
MPGYPTVDINMFVYNGAATLGETIESIIAQTWPSLTLTLIDNGSTDDTCAVAQRYADRASWIRVRKNHANTGPVANCQRAFGHGDADFVMPKTADDLLAPDFVAQVMAVLLEHPSTAMCHAGGLVFTGPGVVRTVYPQEHRLFAVGPDPVERARHVMSHYTSAPSFWGIYRRAAVDRLLRISYRSGWDHAVLAELALYGEIRHVPDFLYWRRDGGSPVLRLARECTAYAQRGLPVDDALADPGWRTPLITNAFNHIEVFSLARIEPDRRKALMELAVQVFRARWLPLMRREAASFRSELPTFMTTLGRQDDVVGNWMARHLTEALIAIETILPEEDFALAHLEIAMLAADRLRPQAA